jgi:hypothetical protein
MDHDRNDIHEFRDLGRLGWGVAGLGLCAALLAFALPLSGHDAQMVPEIASVLAVGAIALLAGHRWAVAIVVVADVLLFGAVWPLAVWARPPSAYAQVIASLALVGALPGLALLRRSLRPTVDLLVGGGRSKRFRAATAGFFGVACVGGIAAPLFI